MRCERCWLYSLNFKCIGRKECIYQKEGEKTGKKDRFKRCETAHKKRDAAWIKWRMRGTNRIQEEYKRNRYENVGIQRKEEIYFGVSTVGKFKGNLNCCLGL